jgi:L-seryl-tRNA(Ser) seleniumtransferase
VTDPRRHLPAVNALLALAREAGLDASHAELLASARTVLARAREEGAEEPSGGWSDAMRHELDRLTRPSLRRVVNATGVVLHTNLGRAPLAAEARTAVQQALGYSTLELDLDDGSRGSRQDHVRDVLSTLTGAEDALVVNNAASALLLTLNGLAAGGETIVSRGELVEIGGSFRIPDILARSGSVLVEVGTTNRTRIRDYELAVTPRTRVLLKVHRSNFQLTGYTEETDLAALVHLGASRNIPAVHDVGSGLLISLEAYGLTGEPLVRDSAQTGATVVFSADKLLGGPQAGVIAGPHAIVRALARNPLARAFRPDKTTFAALEATLMLYRDPEEALGRVPVLAMLTVTPAELDRRARRLKRRLPGARLVPGSSAVGGGSFPGSELPTTLVTLEVASCEAFLELLRRHDPPVIARTVDDRVAFDVRTLSDDELGTVADAARAAGWSG